MLENKTFIDLQTNHVIDSDFLNSYEEVYNTERRAPHDFLFHTRRNDWMLESFIDDFNESVPNDCKPIATGDIIIVVKEGQETPYFYDAKSCMKYPLFLEHVRILAKRKPAESF